MTGVARFGRRTPRGARGAGTIVMFVPPIPPHGAPPNGRTMTPRLRSSFPLTRIRSEDRGAATAEYAIATMAAVGFASLLVVIMQSDEVRGILTDLVRTALTVGG